MLGQELCALVVKRVVSEIDPLQGRRRGERSREAKPGVVTLHLLRSS